MVYGRYIYMVLWLYKTNKQNCRALPALFVNDIFLFLVIFAYFLDSNLDVLGVWRLYLPLFLFWIFGYCKYTILTFSSLVIFCTSLKLG